MLDLLGFLFLLLIAIVVIVGAFGIFIALLGGLLEAAFAFFSGRTTTGRQQQQAMKEYETWRRTHPEEAERHDFHMKWDQRNWDAMHDDD